MRSMRQHILFLGLALGVFAAGQATASTLGVSLVTDNSVCTLNGGASSCAANGSVDRGIGWNTQGGVSSNLAGLGSTATNFQINAVAAVDGGGDSTVQGRFNFDILLDIQTDNALDEWNVDLAQSALGLFGLRGDGTLTAVGNQSDGSAVVSPFTVNVGGSFFNFSATPGSLSGDPSNNGVLSGQFSGNRSDNGILFGTGSQTIAVNVDFDLSAFSNDGCSGFICSSISGGEEAAVLFGAQSVMDQAVDDYSTWGRALGPDGYNSTWTLNVTTIPEPSTALLVALGLTGLAMRRRST